MTVVFLGGLLLAAVFATAGVAKLRDLRGSREAMVSFGVPNSFAGPLGVAVPLAELVVAVCLISGLLRAWGGLGALILLTGFSLAIVSNLAQGRRPDCHCFGQLHSSPAGPRTLARNAGLIALAGLVASQGDPVWTGIAALGGLVLTVAGWALARWVGTSVGGAMSEGLAIGTPAPPFAVPRLDGAIVDLESLLEPDGRTLLVFSDPDCGPCQALAPDLAEWQRRYPGELTIAVIETRGDQSEQPRTDPYDRQNVLLQEGAEVAEAYHAHGTPTAVLIDSGGRIAGGVAGGSVAIEALVADSVERFEATMPATESERWALPRLLGEGGLLRRELLIRGAAAGTALGIVLAAPRQALGAGRRRAPNCTPYRPRCRDRCCPRGAICKNGSCVQVCTDGYFRDTCNGDPRDCLNLDIDNENCGRCGRKCPAGKTCAGGNCVSGDSECDCGVESDIEICCQGACKRPDSDPANCGGCGKVCAGPKPDCCFGHCVSDLDSDPSACGNCLNRCAKGQVCHNGRCRDKCPQGLRKCRHTCGQPSTQVCCNGRVIDREDLQFDNKNCGGCGRKCTGPFDTGECCLGTCCDINGQACCAGGCTNTSLDEENCGACGNVCKPGEFCRFGECVCPLGQTCG